MTLPVPVILKRFLAPECVLFFGIVPSLLVLGSAHMGEA
jgi:hypothetical protein